MHAVLSGPSISCWRRRLLAIVLGCAMIWSGAVPAFASPAPTVGATELFGVRFGGDTAMTRVVLDLDRAAARRLTGENVAGRIVLGLPAMRSAGPLQGPGRGLVTRWSVQDDPDGARLILDVPPDAALVRHFLIPPSIDGGPWRYVIDIRRNPAASGDLMDPDPIASLVAASGRPASDPPPMSAEAPPPAVAYRAQAEAPGPGAPPSGASANTHGGAVPSLQAVRGEAAREAFGHGQESSGRGQAASGHGQRVIVIDAGHGGHDPGARSLVRNEKDITLAAALALKAHLEKMGRYRVVLTRASDVFIPLDTRVQIARRAGADLFISLHADSAGSDPTPHGASIYTLSDSGERRVNFVLGPHEWFGRPGDRRGDPAVGQILLDLTQTSTRNRSSQFAAVLIDHISDRVDLLPRSHRDAGYYVLLAPDVPAVLLEMGFITNPADEMRLTNPAQRDQLMNGVAEAIDAYFSGAGRLAAG